MSRATGRLVRSAAWLVALLGLAGAAEAGTRRLSLDAIGQAIDELRDSVCTLYALTGNAAAQPSFCPPSDPVRACEQPIDPGPCRGAFPRFGFDAEAGRCVAFVWGGCGGNANRFETREACEAACQPNACGAPIDPGPCEAAIPRWAFDAAQGACIPFVYGGCGGNANNFATEEACRAACGGEVDVCKLPADGGPCDAAIPRWFHDAASGRCEPFVYGGCGGNANNFATLEACQSACVELPRCAQPLEHGPCTAALPRWGFDPKQDACVRFVYGGCGANDNNFETQAGCESACPVCDDALCGPHQSCRLFRDPRCLARDDRCELSSGEDCWSPCPPVVYCADVCDAGACPPGTRCELVQVNCVRAPCPPVRECVPDSDPCAMYECGPFQECRVWEPTREPYCADVCSRGACPLGTSCRLEEVPCGLGPCPPVRQCVDPCQAVDCAHGTHCQPNRIGRPVCMPD